MELSTVLVNVAYAIYVGSSFFRDLFRLRIMLIASSVAFLAWGVVDGNASVIIWNVVFGAANTYQVLRLLRLRRHILLTEMEAGIRAERFSGMTDHDFLLFWEMGTPGRAGDEILIAAGERHGRLLLITAGEVEVCRADGPSFLAGVGDFIGEMSLLNRSAAAATVIARGGVEYREWTHDRIEGLARAEPALSASIRAALAEDLSRKLAETRPTIE